MTSSRPRRLLAALAAVPLSLAVAAPAQADAADAGLSAGWLAAQLTDGIFVDPAYGFSDYGLTLDIYIALDDAGHPDAPQVLAAVADQAEAYVTGGTPGDLWAGSTGKLATALQLGGLPTTVGARDLIADLEARVQPTGRATDQSGWGEYSNGIGQAWVAQALALSGSALADETAGYVQAGQCPDGGFPSVLEAPTCESDIDATAFAIRALQVAEDEGVGGYAADVAEAVQFLVAAQGPDGSFGNSGAGSTANANSTGLAALALGSVGESAAATAAADWVRRLLVTPDAATGPLGGEAGAVAYDDAARAGGTTDGITTAVRGQWVRATADAARALALATTVVDSARAPAPDAPALPAVPAVTSADAFTSVVAPGEVGALPEVGSAVDERALVAALVLLAAGTAVTVAGRRALR